MDQDNNNNNNNLSVPEVINPLQRSNSIDSNDSFHSLDSNNSIDLGNPIRSRSASIASNNSIDSVDSNNSVASVASSNTSQAKDSQWVEKQGYKINSIKSEQEVKPGQKIYIEVIPGNTQFSEVTVLNGSLGNKIFKDPTNSPIPELPGNLFKGFTLYHNVVQYDPTTGTIMPREVGVKNGSKGGSNGIRSNGIRSNRITARRNKIQKNNSNKKTKSKSK